MTTFKKGPRFIALRAALALVSGVVLTGCVSLETEEGKLPAAMRGAINTLTAKGYPDLTKIPDAPTNLPTQSTWSDLEGGLVRQGESLTNAPQATPPTAEDTNLSWADTEKRALETDPRAEPLPAVVPGSESDVEWAAKAKAKLDADLARLPPP